MIALTRQRARVILNRWVNEGQAGWSRHAGYVEVAAHETQAAFYQRVNALPYYQRSGQVIESADVCSLRNAKRLVHQSLLVLGFAKGRGDWVQPHWVNFRKNGVPSDEMK